MSPQLQDILWKIAQAVLTAAFTYFIIQFYERKREKQISAMLGDQLAQMVYWIWFFQIEGERVRNAIDEGKSVNPWVAGMIWDHRGVAEKSKYISKSFHVPVKAATILNALGCLPFDLVDWRWKNKRIEDVSKTIYALLPVARAKVITEVADIIGEAEFLAIDNLHSLDAAIECLNHLYRLEAVDAVISDSEMLKRTIGSIDSGVIGVWRVMYRHSARLWDRLHAALRRMPSEVTTAYNEAIRGLTTGMGKHPPLTTDSLPPALHPRPD